MSNQSCNNTEQNDANTDGTQSNENETGNVGTPVNHLANILLSGKGRKLTPKTENMCSISYECPAFWCILPSCIFVH
jgi:hypothetical protein